MTLPCYKVKRARIAHYYTFTTQGNYEKHILLLLALCLGMSAWAQKPAGIEMKALKAFLNQPAQVAATNAAALNIKDLNNPSSWEGVKMEGSRIVEIDWHGKLLAGTIDLSGFRLS